MPEPCASGSSPRVPGWNICSVTTSWPTTDWPRHSKASQDRTSAEAVALMLELALDGVYRMEFSQIATRAGEALEVALPLGDRPLTATAAAALAWGTALTGLVPEARRHRDLACALVDDLSDRELSLRLESGIHLAGAELYLDLFEASGSHSERVIKVARATGQPAFIPFAFMLQAWVHMLRGDLAFGGETLDEAIEEARLLGNAQSLAGLLLNRSLTALGAGDLELAVSTAREGVELTSKMDHGLVPAAATLALAAALLETGDPGLADAVDLMVLRCGGPDLPHMPGGSFRAKWLELLARCSLALGRHGDASRAAARAQALVIPMGGLRMAEAMAARAAAAIALAGGDPHEAARCALASANAADDVGIPIEAALSRTLAGRALARTDQRPQAIAALEHAASLRPTCVGKRAQDRPVLLGVARREGGATGPLRAALGVDVGARSSRCRRRPAGSRRRAARPRRRGCPDRPRRPCRALHVDLVGAQQVHHVQLPGSLFHHVDCVEAAFARDEAEVQPATREAAAWRTLKPFQPASLPCPGRPRDAWPQRQHRRPSGRAAAAAPTITIGLLASRSVAGKLCLPSATSFSVCGPAPRYS